MNKNNFDNLSADILDDDFVKIFRPIHLTQWFLGMLPVKIQYGFVTKISYGYEVFCLFVWLAHIVSLFIFVTYCESTKDSILTDSYLKLAHVTRGLIIAAILFRNFYKDSAHCNVYVSMQKIDRDLNMKDARRRNEHFSLLTKISIAVTVVVSALWAVVLNFYMVNDLCPVAFILQIPVLGNYIDMILIFFTIYFVVVRIEYINSILREKLRVCSCGTESFNETLFIKNDCCVTDETFWNRLVVSSQDIIKVMEELHDAHQFTIFGLTCEFMILIMILVQSIISRIKQQIPIDIYSITVLVPAIMFLFFILLLCIVAETLNSKMAQSRKLCTNILGVSNGKQRNYIKRLLLLLEVKRKISIYDIYTLDAQLPLNLFAVSATYTIVLLQFALL